MVVALNGVYALALDGKFSKAMAHLSRIRKNNEEECKVCVKFVEFEGSIPNIADVRSLVAVSCLRAVRLFFLRRKDLGG